MLQTPSDSPLPSPPAPPLDTKVDTKAGELVTHCIYQIATGKWPPEERLPSVRQAEQRFGVDRRTVLKAYRALEERGLVTCRDRSGFYVARATELAPMARHREALFELYEGFAHEVRTKTGLSTAGVFRYLARLAEIRAREAPECAFVECTHAQAEGHANEVLYRLGVPCLALSLADLESGKAHVPGAVRSMLVSGFHVNELRELAPDRAEEICPVPIEVAPELFASLPPRASRALVLESDAVGAHDILTDLRGLRGAPELTPGVVHDARSELEDILDADRKRLVLLSPRLWGSLESQQRSHPRVRQVRFRVRDEAWAGIAESVGLPLGPYA